ncbi:MAG: MIP/aquaporin family protein [Rhizobiaceae bacterium]|nr:MIP/aquaporin family protein [Rhizobiaceae bacterium]
MSDHNDAQRLGAEFVGTALLLATVVGSGIMGEALADGNTAIALLGNTIPTGAILAVLITLFGPVSGAHFNPAVTLVFRLKGEMETSESIGFIAVQILGGIVGVWAAHAMFGLDLFQVSEKVRTGPDQWFAELVATFGLVMVILGTLKSRPEFVPSAVGLYITAAYWFTASTSFANPAVTIARSFSNTFTGILPSNVPLFIIAQLIGAISALAYCNWQFGRSKT